MILSWPIYGIKATGGQLSVCIKWRLVVNKYYTMYITNTVPGLYMYRLIIDTHVSRRTLKQF